MSAPRVLAVLAFLGFVSLGLPDAVLGVAWPSMRDSFRLPQGGIGLLLAAGGAGYFASSASAGTLLARFGLGPVLAGSTGLVSLGALLTAAAQGWPAAAAGFALVGAGSGAIDAGLNAYAARAFPVRIMSWLHGCYSAGAMAGPGIMTVAFHAGGTWRAGYAAVAVLQGLMTLLFLSTARKWSGSESPPPARPVPLREVLALGAVRLHVVLFVIYTGLEVGAGQWAFTLLTESRGVGRTEAGIGVSAYFAAFTLGRFAFAFAVERWGVDRVLRGCLGAAIAGAALLAIPRTGAWGIGALIVLGAALAPIYPGLMSRTSDRLGPAVAAQAVGLQVSGSLVGAAAVPALLGGLAGQFGLEAIPFALVVAAGTVALLFERVCRRPP